MQAVALFGRRVASMGAVTAALALCAQPALAGDYASFASPTPGPESARTGVSSNLKFSIPLGAPRAARTKPTVGLNIAPARAADFVRPVAAPSGVEAGFSLNSKPFVRVSGEDVTQHAAEKLGFTALQDGGGNRMWWIVGGVVLVGAIVLLSDDDDGGY